MLFYSAHSRYSSWLLNPSLIIYCNFMYHIFDKSWTLICIFWWREWFLMWTVTIEHLFFSFLSQYVCLNSQRYKLIRNDLLNYGIWKRRRIVLVRIYRLWCWYRGRFLMEYLLNFFQSICLEELWLKVKMTNWIKD